MVAVIITAPLLSVIITVAVNIKNISITDIIYSRYYITVIITLAVNVLLLIL